MFSSTLGLLIPVEINIRTTNTEMVNLDQLIGKFTALTNRFGGGWDGFFRSSNMVRLGNIIIVIM